MFCFSVFTFPVILSDCPFSLSVMTAPSLLYHRFHQIHAKFSIFFACIIIIQYIIIRPVSSSMTPIHPRQCLTNCFYILAVLYMKTLNFCCFLTVEIFFFSKGVKKRHPVILRTSFLTFLHLSDISFIFSTLFVME